MNKPDWKDAPEWANYLAMDRNGNWYWHEKFVMPVRDIWMSQGHGKVAVAYETGDAWRETLEERPHA